VITYFVAPLEASKASCITVIAVSFDVAFLLQRIFGRCARVNPSARLAPIMIWPLRGEK